MDSFWTTHACLVILVTMTTLSLADAKAHLSALVARVSGQHERVYVTVHGKPSAVLIATEDLESLEETIEILTDADTMRRLHASDVELPGAKPRHARSWTRPCAAASAPACDRGVGALRPGDPADRSPPAHREPAGGVAAAAYEFITGPLLESPHQIGKQLRPPLQDRHSARRGTYRVIYRTDEDI